MVARQVHHKYLDKGLKGWIVNTAKRNFWRVAAWYDMDDLIQDGFLSYAICRARYAATVENRAHFMALVKIIFLNHITDLANKRTRTPETTLAFITADSDSPELENLLGSEPGEQELMASSHLVVALLRELEKPGAIDFLQRPYRIYKDGTRETRNDRLCRLLKLPTFNIEGSLRAALGG